MLARGPCFTPHGSGTFRRAEDILYTQSLVGDRKLLPPLGGMGSVAMNSHGQVLV